MKDIRGSVRFLITRLKTYKLLIILLLFTLLAWRAQPVFGQAPDPVASVKELKEGCLIIRFPTYKTKIDTLTAMTARSQDPSKKERLHKELQQTIQERDTLLADYIAAFKYQYDFSRVAYIFDYDAHNLNTANYYNLDGERISVADLSERPIFYIYFERTEDSVVDALVIYNRYNKIVPSPFPNNFTRGGINFLFLKISDKKFPGWRVGKINKRLYKYWVAVNEA